MTTAPGAPASRILLFGGSFDPTHRAHTELAAHAAGALDCGRIIFIPAARSPFKRGQAPTSAEHRIAMLEIASRAIAGAEVSSIEVERGGVSYFVDTLEALRETIGPKPELFFLIGADQAIAFDRWRAQERIIAMATPVVLLRRPWTRERFRTALEEKFPPEDPDVWLDRAVDAPLIDVSSTEIRRRLGAGEDTDDMLDPDVLAYIRTHALYDAVPETSP